MDDASIYSSIASFTPQYQRAFIQRSEEDDSLNHPTVNTYRLCKDLEENKVATYLETYVYSSKSDIYEIPQPPIELAKVSLMSYSPSHQTVVTMKSIDKRQIIDVSLNKLNDVSGSRRLRLDVSKVHGDVIADSWFGGQSWSSDERYFVYVAKEKESNKLSRFTSESSANTDPSSTVAKAEDTSKFDYVEDWGERFDGLSSLVIVVLDIIKGTTRVLPGIDSTQITVGQPVFRPRKEPDESSSSFELVYTVWSNLPRKLGMVYCYQRPCSLYHADLSSWIDGDDATAVVDHKPITSSIPLARSPRFDSSGQTLAFIGRKTKMSSHNGCMELFVIKNFENAAVEFPVECLVDLVQRPSTPDAFPGIYCDQLPVNCFYDNDQSILLSSVWGGRDVILSINISSKTIQKNLSNVVDAFTSTTTNGWNNPDDSSLLILDMYRNYILLCKSNMTETNRLILLNAKSNQIQYLPRPSALAVCTKPISYKPMQDFTASAKFKIFQHVAADGLVFESTVLLPPMQFDEKAAQLPLVLVPHGGPHSCIPCAFYSSYAYLSYRLKAGVVFVNFRGSTGYGEDSITSLLGTIGTNDVADCMAALDHALSLTYGDILTSNESLELQDRIFDKTKVAVVGGSHGGFLSAHLIGQYPDRFSAACMRNPVTNIASMTTSSDIPDWTWVESGAQYDFSRFQLPSEELLLKMYQLSPCRYIDNVRTPTLLCLGTKDRRVPPSQGVEYYHLLKSKGVPCRMVIYPEDNHALDKPNTEAEQWLAIIDWLTKYL